MFKKASEYTGIAVYETWYNGYARRVGGEVKEGTYVLMNDPDFPPTLREGMLLPRSWPLIPANARALAESDSQMV